MRSLILGLAVLATGCVSAYRPPTAAQPHATIKIRRVYETTAGTNLSESASIDDHPAFEGAAESTMAKAPRIDAMLVHPRPALLKLENGFWHMETRYVSETYQESTPYTDYERYDCGTYRHPETCSRSVTKYRYETKTRMVWKQVVVSDGSCMDAKWLAPEVDHTYLVEFTYRASNVCTMTCYEQVPNAEGGFENRACRAPTAQQIALASKSR